MGEVEVLVSVEHEDDVAGGGGNDRGYWLSGYLSHGHSTGVDEYEPAIEGLADDRTVEGDCSPWDEVGAEVVDRADRRRQVTAAYDQRRARVLTSLPLPVEASSQDRLPARAFPALPEPVGTPPFNGEQKRR